MAESVSDIRILFPKRSVGIVGAAADLSAMIIGCFATGQKQAALDLVETIVEAGHRYDKAVLVCALPSLATYFPSKLCGNIF